MWLIPREGTKDEGKDTDRGIKQDEVPESLPTAAATANGQI